MRHWTMCVVSFVAAAVFGMPATADGGKDAGAGDRTKTAKEQADCYDATNSAYEVNLAGGKESISLRLFCRSGRFTA
ncbi:MAG: hypothetical protein ABR915_17850, partial [Thermoguttaceae bacterium]